MAASGSGTQQDPYLVDNGYDLLNLFRGRTGYIYVKVTQDINFSDESWYSGVWNEPITGRGELYADSLVSIEGLTIQAASFIKFDASDVTGNVGPALQAGMKFRNLYFKNCCFKATTTNSAVLNSNFSSWYGAFTFTNCKMSMVLALGNQSMGIFTKGNSTTYYSSYQNCAMYFKVSNTAITTYMCDYLADNSLKFDSCNIIIDGLYTQTISKRSPSNFGEGFLASYHGVSHELYCQGVFNSTSLIFKNCNILTNAGTGTLVILGPVPSNIFNSSYVAFIGTNIDGISSGVTYQAGSGTGTNTLSLYTADNPNSIYSDYSGLPMTGVSIADIKDKNYLVSIGFLP